MVWNILLGVFLILLIVLASGVIADVLERFVFSLPIKKNKVVPILISMSLALPELFVGIAAAIDGKAQLALGNSVGANLTNLSLIVGGLAVVSVSVPVVGAYFQKDLWVTMGLTMMPFFLLFDGVISSLEGGVLLGLYTIYAFFFSDEKVTVRPAPKKINMLEKWGLSVMLILALLILAMCSWQLVQVVGRVAAAWGVSWFWIGLVLMAFGTTLPELLLLVFSKGRRRVSLVLPDLLSSVVVNSTLVLGVVALISPIFLRESVQRGISGFFLVAILGLFWLFTKSKKKISRWEGVVLIGVYLMFLGLQFLTV